MSRFKIAYSPESLQEIKHIVDWYNASSKGLGARFKKHLLAEIAVIKQNPFTRSFRYDEVRFAVVKNFLTPPTILLIKQITLLKYKQFWALHRIPKRIGK
jgi:plasmid stabilization system protein ParE